MKCAYLLLGLGLLFVFACQPAGKKPQAEALNDGKQQAGGDFMLVAGQRIGPLYAAHSLENDLVQTFGVQNVKRQEIYLGEGATAPGFVIFGDTRNAVEVYYDTSIVKDRPALLRITEAGTDWKSPEGITIGTTLEELVKINGKPVTFWGFGWDYGGAVSNWNGGKIDARLMLVLEDTRKSTPESLLGDKEILSTASGVDPKTDQGENYKPATLALRTGNMKIRCLIVDDEPLALDVLSSYINRIEGLDLIGRCENALQAFALMQEQTIDLLFLDIQMPKLDGIEFLKTLQQRPKIIFTTAYRDYAIEAFEMDAVDYLLKPIPFSRFLKALSKAYSQFQQAANSASETPSASGLGSSIIIAPGISNIPAIGDESIPMQTADSIIVRADKKMIKVPLEDIQYIESLKDYVIIHVGGRRIVTKQKISYLEQKLPDGKFLRIHRSFLVALNKIQAFSPNHVEINSQELPIGRSYKSEVAKVLGFV